MFLVEDDMALREILCETLQDKGPTLVVIPDTEAVGDFGRVRQQLC